MARPRKAAEERHRHQITIYLDDYQVEALERQAAGRGGMALAVLARWLVAQALEQMEKERLDALRPKIPPRRVNERP